MMKYENVHTNSGNCRGYIVDRNTHNKKAATILTLTKISKNKSIVLKKTLIHFFGCRIEQFLYQRKVDLRKQSKKTVKYHEEIINVLHRSVIKCNMCRMQFMKI